MSERTFTKTPHWVLALVSSGILAPGALVTYAAVGKYVNFHTGQGGWPSNRSLRDDTGFSERTVRDHLRALEECGAIQRVARTGRGGRQTSNLILLIADEPGDDDAAPPGENLPGGAASPGEPVDEPAETNQQTGSGLPGGGAETGSGSPPYERENYLNESSAVVSPSVTPEAATEQTTTTQRPTSLPVVHQRKLQAMGATNPAAWEGAWATALSLEWPEWAQAEADQFPGEHLMLHLLQQEERGFAPSPSRWLRFFIEDRDRRITIMVGQREQVERMHESPDDREARQNRALPPADWGVPDTQRGEADG